MEYKLWKKKMKRRSTSRSKTVTNDRDQAYYLSNDYPASKRDVDMDTEEQGYQNNN